MSFIKDVLIPKLPVPDQTFINYLQQNDLDFNFTKELAEILNNELSGREIENSIVNRRDEIESISISMVEEILDWAIESENKYSENEVVLDFSCTVQCEFDAYVFKADLCWMEDDEVSINEFDWNKHYSWVSFIDSLNVSLLLELDLKENKIISIDIIDLNSTAEY